MRRFSLTIFLSALFLPLPFFVHAQFQALDNNSSGIILSTEPSDPRPNQFVTATVESYAVDLDRANISWIVNGKLEKEAIGIKTFLFKTGSLGTISSILVVIKTTEGEIAQKALTINPSTLDILWEAQSYTPPFYKGKASYPYEGMVKLVAMPRISDEVGKIVNPKTLVYSWEINGDAVPKISGYGRNFMFLEGTIPISVTTIGVEASTLDKKFTAKNSITVTPQLSQILLYEDSPTMGLLYNKTLKNTLDLRDQEIRIASIPYFIGVKNRNDSNVTYAWKQNNQSIKNQNTSSLSFKYDPGVVGTALVGIEVANLNKIFQSASNNLTLNFSKAPSASSFQF